MCSRDEQFPDDSAPAAAAPELPLAGLPTADAPAAASDDYFPAGSAGSRVLPDVEAPLHDYYSDCQVAALRSAVLLQDGCFPAPRVAVLFQAHPDEELYGCCPAGCFPADCFLDGCSRDRGGCSPLLAHCFPAHWGAERLRVLRVAERNGYFPVLGDYSRVLRAYYFRLPDGSPALQGEVPRQLEDCSPVRPGGYSRACFQVLGSPAAGFLPQAGAQLRFLVCRCLHHVLHAVKVVLPSEVRREPSLPVVAQLSVPFLLRVPDD